MNEKQEKIFKEIMEKLPEDIERKIVWYEYPGNLRTHGHGALRMAIGYGENKRSIDINPDEVLELNSYHLHSALGLITKEWHHDVNINEAIKWLKTWRIDKNE